MDQNSLQQSLQNLPLGRVEYHETVGSSNDLAASWAAAGEPHFSLVVANQQTKGRGRGGRTWFTPPDSALAFSILLRPPRTMSGTDIARAAGLGALAVAEALENHYQLSPKIKWPNDILLNGKKVCGILAEAQWSGDEVQSLILGIGINIAPESVPPASELNLPATSVTQEAGQEIKRLDLLKAILGNLVNWWQKLDQPVFIQSWEERLAYRQEWVQLSSGSTTELEGIVIGLDHNGGLRLKLDNNAEITIQAGEIHLRPFVDRDAN